jgi:methyl-accepting chemotaxis protein
MKQIATATQNIAKQINLITEANRRQSENAESVARSVASIQAGVAASARGGVEPMESLRGDGSGRAKKASAKTPVLTRSAERVKATANGAGVERTKS